jgi:3-hydroxy-3-methylglutaryl CoA synthase
MAIGIKTYGAFVPRLRMAKGAIADAHAWALPNLKALARGERALCNWDEDAITMAVQAARHCLAAAPAARPTGLYFASTTAPFADLQNATIVSGALRLPPEMPCQDVSGSTRAGLGALAQTLRGAGGEDHLVIASDRRQARPGSAQELSYGAGAAAFLTGDGDVMARYLGAQSTSVAFVDHFRESGEKYDYFGEERWIRDEGVLRLVPKVIGSLLQRLEIAAEKVAWFGLAGVPAGSDKLVAKALGIAPQRVVPDLRDTVGDTGTAHALLLLASALERGKPGDVVVIAAFGLGCEVLAFEIAEGGNRPRIGLADTLAERHAEASYGKMLSFAGELRLDWGPRAEVQIKAALTQQYRSADQMLAFVGGRCATCAQVQFPRLPICVSCASADTQTPFPLADEPARVATVSADWLQYYPAPPLYVGLIQFDVGARLLMEIVDVPTQEVKVGTPVRFALRLKAHDELRHYTRYFWKAVPVPVALSGTTSQT